jgi:hypothetical protein
MVHLAVKKARIQKFPKGKRSENQILFGAELHLVANIYDCMPHIQSKRFTVELIALKV